MKSRKDGAEWVWLALEGQGDTQRGRSGMDDPLDPLDFSSSSSSKEPYISEEGQEGQEGQGPSDTLLAFDLKEGQRSHLSDLKVRRNGQGGQEWEMEFPAKVGGEEAEEF